MPYGPKKDPPSGSEFYQQILGITSVPSSVHTRSATSVSSYSQSNPEDGGVITPIVSSRSSSESAMPYQSRVSKSKTPSLHSPVDERLSSLSSPGGVYPEIYPQHQPPFSIEKNIEIKKSNIPAAGNGVFTKIDLKKEQPIGIYTGEVITKEEAKSRSSDYIMQIRTKGFYVDGKKYGNWTGKINHAKGKEANVRFLESGKLIAIRNISAGTELLMNYGKEADIIVQGNKKQQEDEVDRKEGDILTTYRFDHINGIDLPEDQITLGEGTYGTVVEGKYKNNPAAIKFSLIGPGLLTQEEFLSDIENIKFAAKLNLVRPLHFHIVVPVTKILTTPMNRIKDATKATHLGIEVTDILRGYMPLALYGKKYKAEAKKLKPDIIHDVKYLMTKLYNAGKYWTDLHAGNVLIKPSNHEIALIDMGMMHDVPLEYNKKIPFEQIYDRYYKDRL